jgi:hypothetical protein
MEATVPEYVLVDGPLAGQCYGSSERHAPGETVVVEVVDVVQAPEDVPRYDYLVDSLPVGALPGRLRHVGC